MKLPQSKPGSKKPCNTGSSTPCESQEPKLLLLSSLSQSSSEREGAAIHPILNSSSYVRHQTKHKRRHWCYLWIRNFHSLKVKQTGEVAFWPPTHWWSVIKRFIYHSVPIGAKFVDFSHFAETPTRCGCLLWISDTGISLTKSTPDMTTVKSIHQIFYPCRNSVSEENQQFATFN